MIEQIIEQHLAEIPDFPQKGVNFKDLNPLLLDPEKLDYVLETIASQLKNLDFNKIVAIDARGFIYGAILANKLKKPLVLARKKGKLPGQVAEVSYTKEYGFDTLTIQTDKITKGDKVLVVDDILATGNTAKAINELVMQLGGVISGYQFIIELAFLKGRSVLDKDKVFAVKIFN